MRYLLTLMIVLVVAAPAMSQCALEDQHQGPWDDNDLPKSQGKYDASGCSEFNWSYDYFRTSLGGTNSLIIAVSGTNASATIPSSVPRGSHSFGPVVRSISSDEIVMTMELTNPNGDKDLFDNIDQYVSSAY